MTKPVFAFIRVYSRFKNPGHSPRKNMKAAPFEAANMT
jgi:hypothetical protein